MTIDDLLAGKNLAGKAQEGLATRTLQSKKAEVRSKKLGTIPKQQAPLRFRDIPASQPNSPLPSPPLSKVREEDNDDFSPLTRGRLGGGQEEEQQAGQSLREQVLAAKQAEAKKKAAKEKTEEQTGAQAGEEATGTKKWSARALALAFWFLPTMIFFVPAILYIDIHILLRWIFGEKLFCKLGDEGGITKIANITGKLAEGATKEFRRIIDIIVVLFSNVVFLSTVFTVVAVIVAVTGAGGGQGWKASDYFGAASNATAGAAVSVWAYGAWWGGLPDWLAGGGLWTLSNILWGAQMGLEMLGQ